MCVSQFITLADTVLDSRRTLSKQDRVKYIDAVKCLMKKPTLTDKKDLPGAKSRYDDFLGTHIVRADDVHFVVRTALTLSLH